MANKQHMRHAGRTRGTVTSIRSDPTRWLVRVYLGTKMGDGRPVREYSSKQVRGTFRQADSERMKMLAEIDAKTFVPPTNQTVEQFVSEWLDGTGKARVAPHTLVSYRQMMRSHIFPAIGNRKLDALSSQEVQRVYQSMTDAGSSPRLVRYTHTVLRMALAQAVEWRVLNRNPTDSVTLPKPAPAEFEVLTAAQVSLFLEQTAADEHGILWNLLLNSGLRPSEAFALTWDDLRGEKLSVSKALKGDGHGSAPEAGPPKTKAGRRTIALSCTTVRALDAHRKRQVTAILRAGPAYSRMNLIFPSKTGTYLDIANVRRWFKAAVLKHLGMAIRLYDLRHTHATLMLMAGVNVKAVSARLGHASVVITLDTYARWLPEMDTNAAASLEQLILSAASNG